MNPSVSAIIPTRDRAELVSRAVMSVLGQTRDDVEVIVVVDGYDDATIQALRGIRDRRLVVEVLNQTRGQCGATNAGIALARAPWVGLLDDDDIWLPDKLERQLAATAKASVCAPIVGGTVFARSEWGEEVWPRRSPRSGEPAADYLFRRSSLPWGETLFQTSTILAPADLMRRVPFRDGLARHSDLDWLIRADAEPGTGLIFPPEPDPVAVWSIDMARRRASHRPDWRSSLEWIRGLGDRVSPQAHAAFVLTWLAEHAVAQGERRSCIRLLREAWQGGRPGAVELAVFAGIMSLPESLRQALSRRGRKRARTLY